MTKSIIYILLVACIVLPAAFADDRFLGDSSAPSVAVLTPNKVVDIDPATGKALVLEPSTRLEGGGHSLDVADKGDKFGTDGKAAYANYKGGEDLDVDDGKLSLGFGYAKASEKGVTVALPGVTSVNNEPVKQATLTLRPPRLLADSSAPSVAVLTPNKVLDVDPANGKVLALEPSVRLEGDGHSLDVFDKGDKFGTDGKAAYANYNGGEDVDVDDGKLSLGFGNAKASEKGVTVALPGVTSVNNEPVKQPTFTLRPPRLLADSSAPSVAVLTPNKVLDVDPANGKVLALEPSVRLEGGGHSLDVADKGDKFGTDGKAAYANYKGGEDLDVDDGKLSLGAGYAKASEKGVTVALPGVTSVNNEPVKQPTITLP